MPGFLSLPGGDMLLRNATVPGCLLDTPEPGLVARDLRIAGGQLVETAPTLAGEGVDLGGSLVFPGFVDMHTHLDKGHIWPRARNADGTHTAAVAAVTNDRQTNWNAADVAARFDFALRCAYAHGTVAIRTHIDSLAPQHTISWPVFAQFRDRWAGRITLQAAAIVPLRTYATPFAETLADTVAEHGGLLGGSGAVDPDGPALVRRLFDLAVERDLDIDLHTDETLDPDAHILRLVAEETIRRGWHGRVNCGHCCSLTMQPPDDIARTIALVAEAGVSVVSLPMVNLYLQSRDGAHTPRWRGITLLHELREAGVRVAVASDNTRDPFYGFGDLDLVEVFREAVRIGHLDLPVGDWPRIVTATPAAIMKLPFGRFQAGLGADIVIFHARDYSELLSRPQSDRVVLRNGQAIDTTPPSYRELDHLFRREGQVSALDPLKAEP